MGKARFENLALAVHHNRDGAMEDIVRDFQAQLFNYALRLLRSPLDAQEVTQDTFMKAYQTLTQRYSGDRCRGLLLRPWLFRITRNLALNRRRGRNTGAQLAWKDKRLSGGDNLSELSTPNGNPESADRRVILEKALNALGDKERDLILLRFFEELPYSEIAAVLQTTEASARGRVFRSLRRLRAVLTDRGGYHAL